jgi:5-methyltetrahydropteroyltriglutamate--homocysteine methyltransferase
MMPALPLFPVTTVGSWPRPAALTRAFAAYRRGTLGGAELTAIADRAVLDALAAQEAAGVDIVTDGEQRRDNFYSFVADKLDGVRLMSLAEMLDLVEDKDGFRQLLDTLDVPAYAIRNPTCVGRVRQREPLVVDDYLFLKRHTSLPIKVTLPGPYLLTRAMWVKEAAQSVYPTKEALAADVVEILRAEARALESAGADLIQFDEPVLTELVFTQGRTRTFMCAALAARKDPAEELELAVSLVNAVVDGLDPRRTALHVCRGNWSPDERTLLTGSYRPLAPYFERMRVGQLVLEYATPRAGEFVPVDGKTIGLGVLNPRTTEVESPESIVARVRDVLQVVEPERVWLNPDCGFGTFASRPMNTAELATSKLASMTSAAAMLRRIAEAPKLTHRSGAVI